MFFFQDYNESFNFNLGTYDAPFLFPLGFQSDDDIDMDQFSQELQFIGSALDDKLTYTAGLYYFREDGTHDEVVSVQIPAFGVDDPGDNRHVEAESKSQAIYAQVTWTPPILDDRLDLTVGGRYTKDTRDASRTLQNRFRLLDPAGPNYGSAPFCDFVTVFSNCDLVIGQEPSGDPNQVTSNSVDSSKFNPAFTANYKWTDDVSTYLRIATGYKAGGSAESVDVGQFGNTFDPEDVTLYELGLKSYLLDRSLRWSLLLFHACFAVVPAWPMYLAARALIARGRLRTATGGR